MKTLEFASAAAKDRIWKKTWTHVAKETEAWRKVREESRALWSRIRARRGAESVARISISGRPCLVDRKENARRNTATSAIVSRSLWIEDTQSLFPRIWSGELVPGAPESRANCYVISVWKSVSQQQSERELRRWASGSTTHTVSRDLQLRIIYFLLRGFGLASVTHGRDTPIVYNRSPTESKKKKEEEFITLSAYSRRFPIPGMSFLPISPVPRGRPRMFQVSNCSDKNRSTATTCLYFHDGCLEIAFSWPKLF